MSDRPSITPDIPGEAPNVISATVPIGLGGYWDFTSPEVSVKKINIDIIARSLSNICRFSGHTTKFYSVAQHLVLCSRIDPSEDAYAKLMHGISKSLLGDGSPHLKRLIPEYRNLERKTEVALFKHFGLPTRLAADCLDLDSACLVEYQNLPACVKKADYTLLVTEKRDVLPSHADDAVEWSWVSRIKPLQKKIRPWCAARARHQFLARFYELCPDEFLIKRRAFHVVYHRLVASARFFL